MESFKLRQLLSIGPPLAISPDNKIVSVEEERSQVHTQTQVITRNTISLCGIHESQCRCWALTLVYQAARNKGCLLLSACASNTETQAFSPSRALCLHRKHEPVFLVMGSIFWPSSLRCLANRKAMSFLHNFSPKNL
ncbi:uncharacterized protein LOC129021050 [Pongo pygmaeus]|uniref:uncharacterized protein LOC129021050 n=1 Tax=Pongo pygmaeus TaxID=9600 RepID=UPI00300C5ED5